MAKGLNLDSPRIRFNWGYHDGASDVRNNRRIKTHHYDKIYLQGYEYGVEDMRNDEYTENSTKAWKSRTSLRRAPWMPHRKKR